MAFRDGPQTPGEGDPLAPRRGHRPRLGVGPRGATIGATTWKTSIFPDKKVGSFLLPLKAEVRKAEGIEVGDSIGFVLEILV